MLQDLRAHQKAMLQTIAAGEAILIAPGEPDVAALGQLRWRMAQQISAYKKLKEERIFPPLLASDDPVCAKLAIDMKTRCDAFAAVYRGFVADWNVSDAIERKTIYRSASLELIGRLRRHFQREESDLVRLAERTRQAPAQRAYALAVGHRKGF